MRSIEEMTIDVKKEIKNDYHGKDIHQAPARPQCLATMYFGGSRPDKSRITRDEFERFINDSITPRFSGFTLVECDGYWKGEAENVRVVTILGEDGNAFRTNVRVIAEHYKSDFGQDAVAYSFAPCEYTLNCWPFGPVGAYHRAGKGY